MWLVVNATPQPLYPGKKTGAHCIEGWVDPGDVLDGCAKSRLHRESITDRPARIPTELFRPLYISGVPKGGYPPPPEIPKRNPRPRSVENKSVTT
jgi:hypothetical protein